ncbi:MAG: DUF721 domain-containing protein [Cyanobacteria bacterium J06638_28]
MQSLQALMQQLEQSAQWQASATLRQILARWPQLVGTAVAQHSQPVKIHRKLLEVSVSSSAWAQTLTFERTKILTKLHQQISASIHEVQDLRFTTVRWRQPQQRSDIAARTTLSTHPSWAPRPQGNSWAPPQNANEAFQQWSTWKQAQLTHQSICPECQRPCPQQELQRWSACAICMTHHWQTKLPKGSRAN